jgi:cytochrome c oxidase cbb3-type subunit 2
MSMTENHKKLERNITLLAICTFIAVAIGGLVQITPLFYLDNTIEKVEGMRPYTPLEQAGRDIYVREGCYTCHSQMIRPFRDEVERYGHYSLAAESIYDHPFQWGSKRTGPDLARVGNRYSDEWHVQHLTNPQDLVEVSIMPKYGFLAKAELEGQDPSATLTALRRVGVPYTDRDIELASSDILLQAKPDADGDVDDFLKRYPKAQIRDFDGNPAKVTEMDALVAYLQMLGTLVDVDKAAAQQQLSEEKGR